MSATKLEQSLENLGRALERLEEALAVPTDQPLAIDGTIQRFEFALELSWKTMKRLLEIQGRQTSMPREVLKYAYAEGWLDEEEKWLQMLRDRNQTAHVYNEEMARRIYDNIKTNFPAMQRAYRVMLERAQAI